MDDGSGWVRIEFVCRLCGEEGRRDVKCGEPLNSPRCKDCKKAMVVSLVEMKCYLHDKVVTTA